jgi:hypothetical protein
MQPIGNILADMNPHKKSATASSGRPSQDSRRRRETAIEALIIRMYQSCRKELPDVDGVDTEVRMAMADLTEIPDHALDAAFSAACVEAGGFVPSNGLIVRCWRETKAKGFEDAQQAIRLENTQRYLLADPADPPTPEQREANARQAAEIARRLRGDA